MNQRVDCAVPIGQYDQNSGSARTLPCGSRMSGVLEKSWTTPPEANGVWSAHPPSYRLQRFTSAPDRSIRGLTCVRVTVEGISGPLEQTVRAVATAAPCQPVVGLVGPGSSLIAILNARPSRFGLRGIATTQLALEPQARACVSRFEHWPEDLARWLFSATSWRASEVRLLVDIVQAADGSVSVPQLVRRLGMSESTLKRSLQRAEMPSPSRMRNLGLALRAAAALQADATMTVEVVARTLGLHDASSLHRTVRAVFDVTPGQARDALGFEGLMVRWCDRVARRAAERGPK